MSRVLQQFLAGTFPDDLPRAKPSFIFFDNNCLLRKQVENDPFFENIALTVDVFHFNSKHKVTDVYCRKFCNPEHFPELKKPDGGWFFNSSIAEQTNVWLANYNSILREMRSYRFNFFLDEMIMRRNRETVLALAAKGEKPGYWV